MPPALWLITLPLGAAPLIYLFRRVGVGGVAAAIVALVSAWMATQVSPNLQLNILGRPIAFDQSSQIVLIVLFSSTAFLFLISSASGPFLSGIRRQTVETDTIRGAGRTFYPVSLTILALFVGAILSRHLAITAILVESAAILSVIIIQGSRVDSTRAAQRFLVFMSLALPLFLLASQRIDVFSFSDILPSPQYVQQTVFLVGVGFALWLAVVPFHSWGTTTAVDASPVVTTFILIAFPSVAILSLVYLLIDVPWLTSTPLLANGLLLAGLMTICVGGVLASVQRGFSGLLGYTAVYDLGCLILLLSIGGDIAVLVVLLGLILRAIALTLLAGAITAIRLHLSNDGFAQAKGMAAKLPWASIGLAIGGFTLVGAPFTFGFALRWQLLQSIVIIDERWPALIILAGIGVAVGYLRGLSSLLSPIDGDTPVQKIEAQEPRLLIVIIGLLILACIGFGVFPNLLIDPLKEVLVGITLPGTS